MKLKFNFGILKGKIVKFEQIKDNQKLTCLGTIKKVKEKNGVYTFSFEDGKSLEILDTILSKMLIRQNQEETIFTYNEKNEMLSGLIGFNMSDTYGFPIEITKEILEEDGFKIDMNGYYVLKQLQKNLSYGTFVNSDGWKN